MKRIALALILSGLLASPALAQVVMHELGSRRAGGLEVSCVIRPPLSQEEIDHVMKTMMEWMMTMGKMMDEKEMFSMATHQLGLIITDAKTKKVVRGLEVTVTAKGPKRSQDFMMLEMPGSYGGPLMFMDKGDYTLTVNIKPTPQAPKGLKPVRVSFNFKYM